MNSIPRWANFLMELVFACICMGIVALLGWWRDQPVPTWAFYIAAIMGGMLWSRPSYSRPQDFGK